MKLNMQIKITPMLTSAPALKGRNTPAYGVSPMKLNMQINITPMLTSTPALKGRNTPA